MVNNRDNNLSVDQPCQLEVESNVSEGWFVAAIREWYKYSDRNNSPRKFNNIKWAW